MIYVLGFDKIYEGRDFHTDASSALLSVFDVYRRRDLKCLLLYRYKLPNLEREWINPKKILTKFGINHPDKIDFSKIDCDYVILYHTEVYKDCPERISELFKFCQENNKDLFLNIKTYKKKFSIYDEGSSFWNEISKELEKFQHQSFQINVIEDEFKVQRILTRDLKLKDLLDGKD